MYTEYDIFANYGANISARDETGFYAPASPSPTAANTRLYGPSDSAYSWQHVLSPTVNTPEPGLGAVAQRRLSASPAKASLASPPAALGKPSTTTTTISSILQSHQSYDIFGFDSALDGTAPQRASVQPIIKKATSTATATTRARQTVAVNDASSPRAGKRGSLDSNGTDVFDYGQLSPTVTPARTPRRTTVVLAAPEGRRPSRPPQATKPMPKALQESNTDFLISFTDEDEAASPATHHRQKRRVSEEHTAPESPVKQPTRGRRSYVSGNDKPPRASFAPRASITSESPTMANCEDSRHYYPASHARPEASVAGDASSYFARSGAHTLKSSKSGRAQPRVSLDASTIHGTTPNARRKTGTRGGPTRSSIMASYVFQKSYADTEAREPSDGEEDYHPEDTLRRTGGGLPQQWKALAELVEHDRKRRQSRASVSHLGKSVGAEYDHATKDDKRPSLARQDSADSDKSLSHLSLLSAVDSVDGALTMVSPSFFNRTALSRSSDDSDDSDGDTHRLSTICDRSALDVTDSDEEDEDEDSPRHERAGPSSRGAHRAPAPRHHGGQPAPPRGAVWPPGQGFGGPRPPPFGWVAGRGGGGGGGGWPGMPGPGYAHGGPRMPMQGPYDSDAPGPWRGNSTFVFEPTQPAPQPQPNLRGPKLSRHLAVRVDFAKRYGWRLENAPWVDSPRG